MLKQLIIALLFVTTCFADGNIIGWPPAGGGGLGSDLVPQGSADLTAGAYSNSSVSLAQFGGPATATANAGVISIGYNSQYDGAMVTILDSTDTKTYRITYTVTGGSNLAGSVDGASTVWSGTDFSDSTYVDVTGNTATEPYFLIYFDSSGTGSFTLDVAVQEVL